ncbi:UDP-glycosyltransferase 708C1-like protein [Drosera capensis]
MASEGRSPIVVSWNIVVATTSARFFPLMATLPQVITNISMSKPDGILEVPGLDPIPIDSIPPPFFDPQHIFTQVILSFSPAVIAADAFIVNTFEFFEPETIPALKDGRLISMLPPIFPIGPQKPLEDKRGKEEYLAWLDEQPDESVVYVCFGSRTTMSKDQIKVLGYGLQSLGHRRVRSIERTRESSERYLEKDFTSVKGRGIVVKKWVNQEMILGHRAMGGFVNHCGWNSVMEAARHGDQRVNAGVAEKAGLAVWAQEREPERGWIGGGWS